MHHVGFSISLPIVYSDCTMLMQMLLMRFYCNHCIKSRTSQQAQPSFGRSFAHNCVLILPVMPSLCILYETLIPWSEFLWCCYSSGLETEDSFYARVKYVSTKVIYQVTAICSFVEFRAITIFELTIGTWAGWEWEAHCIVRQDGQADKTDEVSCTFSRIGFAAPYTTWTSTAKLSSHQWKRTWGQKFPSIQKACLSLLTCWVTFQSNQSEKPVAQTAYVFQPIPAISFEPHLLMYKTEKRFCGVAGSHDQTNHCQNWAKFQLWFFWAKKLVFHWQKYTLRCAVGPMYWIPPELHQHDAAQHHIPNPAMWSRWQAPTPMLNSSPMHNHANTANNHQDPRLLSGPSAHDGNVPHGQRSPDSHLTVEQVSLVW